MLPGAVLPWSTRPRLCTVGVDFGTLSGRAVVVRVRDGAELGGRRPRLPRMACWTTASTRVQPARRDPRPAAGLGAAGARRTTSTCSSTAVPAAVRAAGIDPAQVIGIGTDFTACTVLPVLADGTPLCELPELRRPPARLRQALEAPRRPAAGRPDQRARAPPRGEPWISRYGGLISSEWEFAKGLQLLEEDPEVYDRDGPLGRGRGLDRLAAVRPATSATHARPATRASCQDGRYPGRDFLAALNPASPGSPRTSSTTRSASSGQRAGR